MFVIQPPLRRDDRFVAETVLTKVTVDRPKPLLMWSSPKRGVWGIHLIGTGDLPPWPARRGLLQAGRMSAVV